MMNKGTAALAIPILIGLIKGNKGSKSSQLSKKYDEILKRNQNLIKNNKKMVHEYDIVLEFSIPIQDGEEDLSFEQINLNSSLQNIKENYNKHPSNDFDWDYEDWVIDSTEDISDWLKLMNMGIILDFSVHSDKTWRDEIITKKQVIKMFEKALSGTLSDQEKGYFIKKIAEPFNAKIHYESLADTAEYEYGIHLPPNLTEAGNYELLPENEEIPDWFIESRYSSKAYDGYKEHGFIDALSEDFFRQMKIAENEFEEALEKYDIAKEEWFNDEDGDVEDPGVDPRNEFWDYLYEDANLQAHMKLYSIAQNLEINTEIAYKINDVLQHLLLSYGEIKIISIAKKHKGTRLRRR